MMHPMTAKCLLITAVFLIIAISAEATQCYQCSYKMAESPNTNTSSNSRKCLSTDPLKELKEFNFNCSVLATNSTSGKTLTCTTQYGPDPESISCSCTTMVNLNATEKCSGTCGPPEDGITTCFCRFQLCKNGTKQVLPISNSTTQSSNSNTQPTSFRLTPTQPIPKVGARTSASIGLRSSLFAVVFLALVAGILLAG